MTHSRQVSLLELTGNGVIESLLGQVASLIGGVQNLVVEDGEVQGETQADGVGGRKLGLSNLSGSLVGVERLVGGVLALVANGELSQVAVVVTLPVVVGSVSASDSPTRSALKRR